MFSSLRGQLASQHSQISRCDPRQADLAHRLRPRLFFHGGPVPSFGCANQRKRCAILACSLYRHSRPEQRCSCGRRLISADMNINDLFSGRRVMLVDSHRNDQWPRGKSEGPCCGIELQVGCNNSDIGLAAVFESLRFGFHRLCVLW
jgi:hypothetical protein